MSSLFSGPTTTTNQNITQQGSNSSQGASNQQGTTAQMGSNTQTGSTTGAFNQTSTPNLPAWYSTFLQQIPGQYQQLAQTFSQNAQKPLYGQTQQANFQNQLAHSQGAANQTLQSQLASQGALNSGRAAQMDTQQSLGGQAQLANYLAAVPGMNAQNQLANLQGLQGAIQGQAGFTSPIGAFGSTTSGQNQQQSIQDLLSSILGQSSQSGTQQQSGTSQSNGTSNTTQQQSGGFMQSLLNAGLGYLTGGLGNTLGNFMSQPGQMGAQSGLGGAASQVGQFPDQYGNPYSGTPQYPGSYLNPNMYGGGQ